MELGSTVPVPGFVDVDLTVPGPEVRAQLPGGPLALVRVRPTVPYHPNNKRKGKGKGKAEACPHPPPSKRQASPEVDIPYGVLALGYGVCGEGGKGG